MTNDELNALLARNPMTQEELDFLLKRNPALSVGEPVRQPHGNAKPPATLLCKTCGVAFPVVPCMAKHRQYCSPACAYDSKDRVKHVQKKERGTRFCLNCSKEFLVHTSAPDAKCCCQKCAASITGRTTLQLHRHVSPPALKVVKPCATCGTSFSSSPSANRRFCSRKCATDHQPTKTARVKAFKASSRGENIYSRCPKGWVILGDKQAFCRSRWEAQYARYLQWMKERGSILDWEHEPETFWFHNIQRGVRSYMPDFKVTALNGSHEWHEVKGWMDQKSRTKLKRMAKYYPSEAVLVIDSKWFKANKSLANLVPLWDAPHESKPETSRTKSRSKSRKGKPPRAKRNAPR